MKKLIVICAVVFFIILTAGCVTEVPKNNSADMVIYGPIYTVDSKNTVAEALAVKDGIITYVGSKDGVNQYVGDKTEILNGNFVLPGFISAHEHGNFAMCVDSSIINLLDETSYQGILDKVSQYVKENPDSKVIRGGGWKKEYVIGEHNEDYSYAADLDAIAKDKVIILESNEGHMCWVNSKVIDYMGFDKNTPDPSGGKIFRDNDGNPNGIFFDKPYYDIMEKFPKSIEVAKKGIMDFQDYLLSKGVTAHVDAIVNISGTDINAALMELDKEGKLKGKVYGYVLLHPGDTDVDSTINKILKLKKETEGHEYEVKSLKLFVDGGTPYMFEEYNNKPGYYGQLSYPEETINEAVDKAKKNNLQVHFHSLGDKTFHVVVDALEKAYKKYGVTDGRDSITHIIYAKDDDIKKAGKLGVTATLNPYWFDYMNEEMEKIYIPTYGKERVDRMFPAKSLADAGSTISAAADYSVTPFVNPLVAIQCGVERSLLGTELNPSEALTLEQMIRAVTYGGAYQNGDEKNRGSLEVGKVADIVIINEDLRKMDPKKIASDAKVEKTILHGKVVYDAEKSSETSSDINSSNFGKIMSIDS